MDLTPKERANLDEFHNIVDFHSPPPPAPGPITFPCETAAGPIPSTRHALRIDVLCVAIGLSSFFGLGLVALGFWIGFLIFGH